MIRIKTYLFKICKLVQPLWRTVWRFLKKTGNNISFNGSLVVMNPLDFAYLENLYPYFNSK